MGLTPAQVAIIKATAPAVGANAVKITQAFYPRMFRGNPEVLEYFNLANQSSGRQPEALAGALVGYATHIDDLGVLGPAVERIVQKHVGLMVPPEGYPVVGKHLMDAIHEVLGEAVTPEVHDAWVAAYGQLADILIAAEKGAYEAQAAAAGGWRGWRQFTAEEVRRGGDNGSIVHLRLTPVDGGAVSAAQPGQFLPVHFEEARVEPAAPPAHQAPRHYSVVGGDAAGYDICVRHLDQGLYSPFIHGEAKKGPFEVSVGPPAGSFTYGGEEKAVFIAGGIGFTPLVPMARACASPKWLSIARTPSDATFAEDLLPGAAARQEVCTDGPATEAVGAALSKLGVDSSFTHYVCGPPGMIEQVAGDLFAAGVPRENVKYELFGPHIDV